MPSGGILNRNGTPDQRFWGYVHKTENCWFWVGSCNSDGYGSLKVNGFSEKAHVLSYKMHFGSINGAHVLHRCDIPQCVRPEHLYLGTHGDNMRDRATAGTMGHLVFKTHCPQGHEYTLENTFVWARNGNRACRACHKAREQQRRTKEN